MKQAELVSPKKFVVKEVDIPVAKADQVLIKVHAIGICGTDIHAYYGKHPFISCPIVLGHEATGEVVKMGEGVTGFSPGDRVVIRPQSVCGECLLCEEGRPNICNSLRVNGCQFTGTSGEYYAIDASLAYKIPDSAAYDEATLIEPLAVGVHAVRRGAADIRGKKALVIGAGAIGNMVAQSAKGMGAAAVMISDISDYKLDIAKKCGVDYAVNIKQSSLASELTEKFGRDGADVIFECSASESALNEALSVGRKGINIVILGVYGSRISVNMANVQDREYSLIGSLMYLDEDYRQAIQLLSEGRVDLMSVISHRFSLDEIAAAYEFIDKNKDDVQKVILTVD